MPMKKQIEATLAVLVGQAMHGSHRAADMEMFEFGNAPSGASGMSFAHTIHVQCPWRLTAGAVIVTGYDDVRYPTGSNPLLEPRGFRWDAPGANRRDERLQTFFDQHRARPPVVTVVEADDLGSLRLELDQNVRLELFPDDSLNDLTDSERWRFFQPGADGPHFLVTGGGCDTVVG
jgi:hypothetical protein